MPLNWVFSSAMLLVLTTSMGLVYSMSFSGYGGISMSKMVINNSLWCW